MIKNIFALLVAGLFLVQLFGCVSTQNQMTNNVNENRQVAAASENQQHEAEFMKLINSANANQLAQEKIDKLFTLLLKSNLMIDQFSQNLDAQIAYKKKNPKSVLPELSQSLPYRSLLKAWNLKERYSHEIEYLYSRALEIRGDFNSSEDLKMKTRLLLKTITTDVKSAQNLKRVELQPLLTSLQEIYSSHIQSYKQNLNEVGHIKDVSAISEVPEYSNLIFNNPTDLMKYAQSVETKEKSSAVLSQAKYKNASAQVDIDLDEVADPIFDRNPQSMNQDLICKNGKKLCVSTGESGNMVGGVFPPGTWAFTYDDGPSPAISNQIMDSFMNYKDSQNSRGRATFFWTAYHFDPKITNENGIKANQAMIKKAIDNGFIIANHSYDHLDLNRPTTDRYKQIITANQITETAIRKEDPSYKIQYYRCPYGSCYAPKIPAVRQMLVDQGQMHVYWRIDSLDWKFKNSTLSSDLIMKQIEAYNHGIILMHDVQPTTPETTRIVLAWLKDQNDNHGKNYKMVTIPEALDLVNGK